MPKVTTIKQIVHEILKTDQGLQSHGPKKEQLRCKLCNVDFSQIQKARLKNNIRNHVDTAKHKEALVKYLASNQPTVQPNLVQTISRGQEQRDKKKDLIKGIVAANIPLFKLENPILRSALESQFGTLPCRRTITDRYIPEIYQETMDKIKQMTDGKWLYFVLDETQDIKCCQVVNVLVGVLDGEEQRPMLMHVQEIEAVNNQTIGSVFMKAVMKLTPDMADWDRIRLVVTDQASYNLLAFENQQKANFPHLIHVTCVAHAMHRACEHIRGNSDAANSFLSCMADMFSRSSFRRQLWKSVTGGLALPPMPVVTRWGTWLEATIFVATHWNEVKMFMEAVDAKKSKKIEKAKKMMENDALKNELVRLAEFKFIVSSIAELETASLTLLRQKQIVQTVLEKLTVIDESVKNKLEKCLDKNPGYKILTALTEPDQIIKFRYAPLTSVDVERSFSVFNNVYTSHRTNMSPENLERQMVIICNPKLL